MKGASTRADPANCAENGHLPDVCIEHHIEPGYNMAGLTASLQISRATAYQRERQLYPLLGNRGDFLNSVVPVRRTRSASARTH